MINIETRSSCIYGIYLDGTCVYIGKIFGRTTVDKRRREHLHYLRHNKHHSEKLQMYYNTYGENSLNFKVIQIFSYITNDNLCLKEEDFIKQYNTYNSEFGCNVTRGGHGKKSPTKTETIRRISQTKIKGFEEGLYIKTDGEINGMHVLTEDEVREIVSLFYQRNMTHQQIADQYGVIRQTISLIYNGQRWKYLKEVREWVDYKKNNVKEVKRGCLTKLDVYEIKCLLKFTKMKQKEIASIYGVVRDTIRRINTNKRYQDVDITKEYKYYKEEINVA